MSLHISGVSITMRVSCWKSGVAKKNMQIYQATWAMNSSMVIKGVYDLFFIFFKSIASFRQIGEPLDG